MFSLPRGAKYLNSPLLQTGHDHFQTHSHASLTDGDTFLEMRR